MRSTKRTTGVAAGLFPAVGLVWCCICMENTESGIRLRLADVFVSIEDPRQAAKVEHDLVELLVVAVAAVLAGADTFVEIEIWAGEKLDWLRRYLPLVHGIASHDTFGRLFGLIEPGHFEAAFRRWMQGVLPALDAQVVAIDGKTGVRSDRSSSLGGRPAGVRAEWTLRSCILSRPLRPATAAFRSAALRKTVSKSAPRAFRSPTPSPK